MHCSLISLAIRAAWSYGQVPSMGMWAELSLDVRRASQVCLQRHELGDTLL